MTWSPFSNVQVPQSVIFSDSKFGSNSEGENLRLLRKRGVKGREGEIWDYYNYNIIIVLRSA